MAAAATKKSQSLFIPTDASSRSVVCFSRRLRYDTCCHDNTLLHVGKAITPTAELHDAGILIRDGEMNASASGRVELPAGATEIRAEDSTAIPVHHVHIHGAGGRDVMEVLKHYSSVSLNSEQPRSSPRRNGIHG